VAEAQRVEKFAFETDFAWRWGSAAVAGFR
jgi:hypothetical protein